MPRALSRTMELAMVRGILTQHVMEAVSKEMFGGEQGRQLIDKTLPQVESSAMPADQKRALLILLVSFGFAMIVFAVRIEGSVLGFIGISIACALMAATFGLLVAAIGNSPATTRGVTTLAVLMMVMLGGAWVPSFIFPAWLQQATLVVIAFAALFWTIAAARFKWEEA